MRNLQLLTCVTLVVGLLSIGHPCGASAQSCAPPAMQAFPMSAESTIDDTFPFAPGLEPDTFTQAHALAIRAADIQGNLVDLNEDGFPDLVIGGNGAPAVVVYYLDGSGGEIGSEELVPAACTGCYHVEVAKLNDDGQFDIVLSRALQTHGPQDFDSLFLNDASGGPGDFENFPPSLIRQMEVEDAAPFDLNRQSLGCNLGQIDNDVAGALDFVVGGSNFGIRYYVGEFGPAGSHDFRFEQVKTYSDGWTGVPVDQPARWREIELADVDGNGTTDMIASRANGVDPDRVWLNTGPASDPFDLQESPQLQRPPTSPIQYVVTASIPECSIASGTYQIQIGPQSFEHALGDIDGDGVKDLVITSPGNQNAVYLGHGNGQFGCIVGADAFPSYVFPVVTPDWGSPGAPKPSAFLEHFFDSSEPPHDPNAFPDFNYDPDCDYAFIVPGVFLNGCTGVALADMNGDGRLDVGFSNRNDIEEVCVYDVHGPPPSGFDYLNPDHDVPTVKDFILFNMTSVVGQVQFRNCVETIEAGNDGTGYAEFVDMPRHGGTDGRPEWLDANFANLWGYEGHEPNHMYWGKALVSTCRHIAFPAFAGAPANDTIEASLMTRDEFAGLPFVLFASKSGEGAFDFGGEQIPLEMDELTLATLDLISDGSMTGVLDGKGDATFKVELPKGFTLDSDVWIAAGVVSKGKAVFVSNAAVVSGCVPCN